MILTSETKTFTVDDLKEVVKSVKSVADIIDVDKIVVTETPKKDDKTKRTDGTMTFPPRPGKKTVDVIVEIAKIKEAVRRALRQLADDETSISTDEEQTIVTGDDDSVASDPAAASDPADAAGLYIGLAIGGLVILALVVAAVYMVRSKKQQATSAASSSSSAPTYLPHHEL